MNILESHDSKSLFVHIGVGLAFLFVALVCASWIRNNDCCKKKKRRNEETPVIFTKDNIMINETKNDETPSISTEDEIQKTKRKRKKYETTSTLSEDDIKTKKKKSYGALIEDDKLDFDRSDPVKFNALNGKTTKPKGLQNLGNTCFMDAILQNLAWCPKLQTELEKAKLTEFSKMSRSVLELLKYTNSEDDNTAKLLEYKPFDILSAARERNSIFNGYRQQDSFEMFNTIIDAIREEMLTITKASNPNVFDSVESDDEHIMREYTGVRLFFGTFVTQYDYSSCEHVECVFQRFSSITVPIVASEDKIHNNPRKDKNNKNAKEPQLPIDALTGIQRGMIHGLMKPEFFEEEMLPCRKCEQPSTLGECKKTMLIFEPPFIMVLHIDRFRENGQGGMDKRNDKVTYPETLNIDQFCSQTMEVTDADQQHNYSLFGVVAHSGGLSSGHYVAYIKTIERSQPFWYENINKSWKDPDKSIKEVEYKLEELKKNASTIQSKSSRGYVNKQEEQKNDTSTWYYISDSFVKVCKKEDAINNKNAYILLYEKM